MRLILTLGIVLAPTFSWAARDRSHMTFSAVSINTSPSIQSLNLNVPIFSTSTSIQLLLTDPLGNQTGFLGPNGPQINNIPRSGYTVDATEDIDTPASGPQGTDIDIGPPAVTGQYGLTFFAIATTAYQGHIRAAHSDGSLSTTTFQGFVVQDSSRQYSVNFNPVPGGQLAVVKIATFDTLRQDLQTAFQLGMIFGPSAAGIFNSLDAKLRAAQDAGARGDNKTASNQLNAFISELKAQQGKHLATTAFVTLQADAQTLISKLGT